MQLIQDSSSKSVRSDRYRNPQYCYEFYDNHRPKSSRSTSHNSHHYRRHRRRRYRDLDELRSITPSRGMLYSNQDTRDYRNRMSPVLGPSSLPPPSPLQHSPLPYPNRSQRRYRKKERSLPK